MESHSFASICRGTGFYVTSEQKGVGSRVEEGGEMGGEEERNSEQVDKLMQCKEGGEKEKRRAVD